MMDEYLTNLNTSDLDDTELLNKLKQKEEELNKIKKELDEKSKLCLSQKHKIEDLSIEKKDMEDESFTLFNTPKFDFKLFSKRVSFIEE